MAANQQQQPRIKDVLMPFKMRTGRKRNPIWNYFTRYKRQTFNDDNDVLPSSKRLIAMCNKCDLVHCTNLDTLANHILFGDDVWSGTAKRQARDIIDAVTNRRSKRKRTLYESNQENANVDHSQVCVISFVEYYIQILFVYHVNKH